jgi:hypothetical protein
MEGLLNEDTLLTDRITVTEQRANAENEQRHQRRAIVPVPVYNAVPGKVNYVTENQVVQGKPDIHTVQLPPSTAFVIAREIVTVTETPAVSRSTVTKYAAAPTVIQNDRAVIREPQVNVVTPPAETRTIERAGAPVTITSVVEVTETGPAPTSTKVDVVQRDQATTTTDLPRETVTLNAVSQLIDGQVQSPPVARRRRQRRSKRLMKRQELGTEIADGQFQVQHGSHFFDTSAKSRMDKSRPMLYHLSQFASRLFQSSRNRMSSLNKPALLKQVPSSSTRIVPFSQMFTSRRKHQL